MAESTYILTNSFRRFPFLQTSRISICGHSRCDGHSEQCAVVPHCSFNLHFYNKLARRSISPGCSLEGLMLKLKLQYFAHLMRRADSLEKTLILGGIGDRRRRGRQFPELPWAMGPLQSLLASLSWLCQPCLPGSSLGTVPRLSDLGDLKKKKCCLFCFLLGFFFFFLFFSERSQKSLVATK